MTRRQSNTLEPTPRSKARLRFGRTAVAVLASLGVAHAASAASLPTDWLDYTAVAENRLVLGSNIEVFGNYAVTQPGGELVLQSNLFHSSVPPESFLAADNMEFFGEASANNVFVNTLQLNNTSNVRGKKTTPWAFPITVNIPPFPPGITSSCTSGAADVTVDANATVTLPAGCYRNLLIRHDGTLRLSGGDYTFLEMDVQQAGQILAVGASVVSVQKSLNTGIYASVSPQSGKPADLLIFSAGKLNRFGNDGVFIGRIVAPNDNDLEFGVRLTFVGNAYADEIIIFGVHLYRTPTPTPSPTPTPTKTPPPTATPTPTPTPSVTPTPTLTPSGPPTPTPTPPTHTPTPTPPATPTPTSPPQPTPTQPFVPPPGCGPNFTSPNPCR